MKKILVKNTLQNTIFLIFNSFNAILDYRITHAIIHLVLNDLIKLISMFKYELIFYFFRNLVSQIFLRVLVNMCVHVCLSLVCVKEIEEQRKTERLTFTLFLKCEHLVLKMLYLHKRKEIHTGGTWEHWENFFSTGVYSKIYLCFWI